MDTGCKMKAKTLAELLPELEGILTKEARQRIIANIPPCHAASRPQTAEKVLKPKTIAEMKADLKGLLTPPKRHTAATTSKKQKIWNSSVKVDKKISLTNKADMQHNPVRKTLNFQSRPNKVIPPKVGVVAATPKFPKPILMAKKSLLSQAHNTQNIADISGICKIPETPKFNRPFKSRMTIANKENVPRETVIQEPPVKSVAIKRQTSPILNTPLTKESWNLSNDESFLQKENEIQKVENIQEFILENITEVSPPASTPFKDFRTVKELFDNTNNTENSVLDNDDTITIFNPDAVKENRKEDESIIMLLCDQLHKAVVTDTSRDSTKIQEDSALLDLKYKILSKLEVTEASIQIMGHWKKSLLSILQIIEMISNEKNNDHMVGAIDRDKILSAGEKMIHKVACDLSVIGTDKILSDGQNIRQEIAISNVEIAKYRSVIRSCSKSPSYKIPKKMCLRKKVLFKSVPNISNNSCSQITPQKNINKKALSEYMEMKEQLKFLNTPVLKHSRQTVVDTPATTSHNLQTQLSKLYGDS